MANDTTSFQEQYEANFPQDSFLSFVARYTFVSFATSIHPEIGRFVIRLNVEEMWCETLQDLRNRWNDDTPLAQKEEIHEQAIQQIASQDAEEFWDQQREISGSYVEVGSPFLRHRDSAVAWDHTIMRLHEERELQIARSEELDSAPQEQAMEDQANGEETTEEVAVDKHLDIGVLPIRGGRPT